MMMVVIAVVVMVGLRERRAAVDVMGGLGRCGY